MIPFREIVAGRRWSRVFCMLSAYLDESYNNRTFCVGGWVLPDKAWIAFERDWNRRIEMERRNSAKKGFPPISRYHAADCANLRGEFAEDKGWDCARQLRLSKSLLGTIIKHRPHGVVIGGSIEQFLRYFPDDKGRWRDALYYVSVSLVLKELAEMRRVLFPSEQISVFYDRGSMSSKASRAFDSMKFDPRNSEIAPGFYSMGAVGWEDCSLLQSADLLAYEGMKRLDGRLTGRVAIRKSFASLLGEKVDIGVAAFTDEYYRAIQQRKLEEIRAIMEAES
jgi:hypothetical protein